MIYNRYLLMFLLYFCSCVVQTLQQQTDEQKIDETPSEVTGCGKINMVWPGLNAPVLRGREMVERQEKDKEVSFTFHGLIPAVFTPFNEDLSVNLSVIPEYVQYLKSKGVKGILVHGSTGEGVSMSTEERITSAEQWIRFGKAEGFHVMVQVGGGALPHVVQLAQHAEKHGADSILTLPELYFKPKTPTELVDYLEIISKAAPRTPLLYYHFPARTCVQLNMAKVVSEAQQRIKTFRGVKMTTPNLEESEAVHKVSSNTTVIFVGAKSLMVPAFVMGLDSSIGTTFSMFFDYVTQILHGSKNPELLGDAVRKQRELNDLVSVITKYGSWLSSMKAAMNIISGINVGPVRPPNKPLTLQQTEDMARELRDMMSIAV